MVLLSKLRPLILPKKINIQNLRKGHGSFKVKSTFLTDLISLDYVHFYYCLAAIPMLMFGTYMSIFVGDAELAEIPEGYTPEYWEYERNPVQRLFARYCFKSPIQAHEEEIAELAAENDKRFLKKAISEVKMKMHKYRNYKAWFYEPSYEAVETRNALYHAEKSTHIDQEHEFQKLN